jgi:sensor histidine kinase regulating citrate/malate metabolism
MSRLSFAVTIAVLVCALVVLSVFALQKLFVSGTGNEGSTEATEEMTRATQETTQATQTTEETTAYGEETTAHGEITITTPYGGTSVLQEEDVLEAPPDSTLSYGGREV